ncbi:MULTISPECIES: DUF2795 domain-containing protein [Streptosporangium]|uniref:DUF2795 domain-containing protein n=1 Tax=Streptosporangium brasiliense TaxID=47480 RepID=A0ABT9RMI7_9ACTN|nr:DUF2795 domain-containing protein [Streptosporangium brasiliense]MDP9870052.1 hypothetical protein [Streptosporangium brasiliense]
MIAERGSAKHGPRVDEEQKHETEGVVRGTGPTHAEEWADPGGMVDPEEEAAPRRYPPGHAPGTPEGITPTAVERRSALAKWLSDAHWPSDRDELLAHAETKLAPDAIVESLRDLPDGEFHNIGEVARALGLGAERRRW